MSNTHDLTNYRECRHNLTVPARFALGQARERAWLAARMAESGFVWKVDRHYRHCASWRAAGFDLSATIMEDSDGWWYTGIETYGHFTSRWRLGAIRHHYGDGGRQDCEWFMPANPAYAKQDYHRARTYGLKWAYFWIEVRASREGIVLGEAALYDIERDLDKVPDDHMSELAFELADEAVTAAEKTLNQLCGCRSD